MDMSVRRLGLHPDQVEITASAGADRTQPADDSSGGGRSLRHAASLGPAYDPEDGSADGPRVFVAF